jgi:hypothetical protein
MERETRLELAPPTLARSVAVERALFFHAQLIERYGGATGVRDLGALESGSPSVGTIVKAMRVLGVRLVPRLTSAA